MAKAATKDKLKSKPEKSSKVVDKKVKKTKAVALDDLEPKSKAKAKEAKSLAFDYAAFVDAEIRVIEKKTKVSSGMVNRYADRVSTGVLAIDMYLDGGLVPGGWYTFSGGEQSCKSTLSMCVLASCIKAGMNNLITVSDFEGSTDAEYVCNQLETFGLTVDPKQIFGIKDDETGEWIIKPLIRYYTPDTGEAYFDFMAMLRRALPDKVVEKDGSAYYIFENNKANAAKVKGKYDVKWFSKHNQFKVKAEDAKMQMLSIVDSYPAMMPESQDVDDPSAALAVQARMFSDGIKRIRGGMRRKMITILGINQLRQKPMQMFGDPAYEPGGDALKFYCFAYDTELQTNVGPMLASELKERLMDGQEIMLESLGGYLPVQTSFLVPDAPKGYVVDALGHSYIGSARHKALFLHVDKAGKPRMEFLTLDEVREIKTTSCSMLRVHTEVTAEHIEAVKEVLNNEFRTVSEPINARMSSTYIRMETPELKRALIKALRMVGIVAAGDGTEVVLPAVKDMQDFIELIYNAANPEHPRVKRFRIEQKNALWANELKPHLGALIGLIEEYNASNLESIVDITDIDQVKQMTLRVLRREFITDAYDQFDLTCEQDGYLEDLLNHGTDLVPIPTKVTPSDNTEFWDVCVPASGAVITNGLVSHNSDVRIRLASRAAPAGWKAEAGIVTEESVTVPEGLDRYRFIAAKTIKNKMGGIPNQQTWMRLWESDGNGQARGFDPVYDTFYYMKTIGLIAGTRNKIKFLAPCPLVSTKSINWDEFRTLINGSKKQIADVCKGIGVKPSGLRFWCFKFIQTPKGKELLKSSITKKLKSKASSDGDDDE